jgi:hypothetical protein
MNPRLLTPTIVLVSFGAAFGLMGWHAGLWHPAAADDPAAVASAPLPAPTTAATTLTPPAALPGPPLDPAAAAPPLPELAPEPVVTQEPNAAPEDAPPAVVSPEAQAQESEGFLDARDRAAEHGARSH